MSRMLDLLALEISDLKTELMAAARYFSGPSREATQSYRPYTTELGLALVWLRAYQEGRADYEMGCHLLHDGNLLYNAYIDQRYTLERRPLWDVRLS